ncbi:Ig-like domain-containing protein [Flavonifractor sp. HCP28S3_F3]|uniref:Ig-like domain-containing protein n=1 Tax=Flavonifractor sp. HCP28S3_F3 TaxID=3438939 RepID=UPI003F8C7F04
MASRRGKDERPKMIHCEYCGEDYSSTYKHCPFCDEVEQQDYDDQEEYEDSAPRSRGGKRLVTNTRGGGYGGSPSPLRTVGMVLSLALIVAAVIIVITIIMPLVSKGHTEPGSSVPPESSAPVTEESETPGPEDSTPPAVESPENTIPAEQTATGFTLDQTEFSFSDRYPDPITVHVTFIPAGSTGTITWTSSDPSIVSVDENGKVSHGTTRGSATITASLPGAADQTILVYNQVTSGTSSSSGSSSTGGSTSTGTLSLNKTDFTFSAKDNPSVQMKVNGTSSTPVWSIGNTAVATISADGVVKPVGPGSTTITCTVDGQTLKCIVRCSF